ncbi:MAG: hypothetical protein Q9174_005206, partial [Haloplaca sp. 1 TL-2023]
SPRWYIKKHKYERAFESLKRLRNTPLQAARDLYYIYAQVRLEELEQGFGDTRLSDGEERFSRTGRYFSRFQQLFLIPRIRRATLAAFVVMIAQQLCGSRCRSAIRTLDPILTCVCSQHHGILLLHPFRGSQRERAERSACIMGICPAHLGMITFFIYLFAAFYSPGEGPVPFTYSAEAFPLFHREVGMSLAVSINLFFAGIEAMIFPKLTDALTPTGAIGLFAGFNIVALVMIFLWVPETKQRTLEELDYIFAVPTTKHMRYQVFEVLPYTWKRYVLRRDVDLDPLYIFR